MSDVRLTFESKVCKSNSFGPKSFISKNHCIFELKKTIKVISKINFNWTFKTKLTIIIIISVYREWKQSLRKDLKENGCDSTSDTTSFNNEGRDKWIKMDIF